MVVAPVPVCVLVSSARSIVSGDIAIKLGDVTVYLPGCLGSPGLRFIPSYLRSACGWLCVGLHRLDIGRPGPWIRCWNILESILRVPIIEVVQFFDERGAVPAPTGMVVRFARDAGSG